MGTINTSMQAVQQAQSDLEKVEELPPLGDDMVRNACMTFYYSLVPITNFFVLFEVIWLENTIMSLHIYVPVSITNILFLF